MQARSRRMSERMRRRMITRTLRRRRILKTVSLAAAGTSFAPV
jgi:hypothetical protein